MATSIITATHLTSNIRLNGDFDSSLWNVAEPIRVEKHLTQGNVITELSTEVRAVWTDDSLFIRFVAPYSRLTVFEPAIFEGKRVGLWERDVVEVFVNPAPEQLCCYDEFQVAPTGERLDLRLSLPHRDFLWNSEFQAAVQINSQAKNWTTLIAIPFAAFGTAPTQESLWRINFFRNVASENTFLAWCPTTSESAHIPKCFGDLRFSTTRLGTKP